MNARALAACLLLAISSSAVAGKVYKWVDEEGRVQFSDRPPPTGTKAEEHKVFSGVPDATLPFALRQVTANFPVTIYTAENCKELCDNARALLKSRGIPFSEKGIRSAEDVKAYEALFGGKPEVPAATVGNQQLRGFSASSWNALLDQVGYPKTPLPGQ